MVSSWRRWWQRWLTLPLAVLNGWVILLVFQYFQSLLTIIAVATLLAFLLNYPVQKLEQRLSRLWAVLSVFLLALVILGILGVTLVPALITQLEDLAQRLPTWIDSGNQQLQSFQSWASENQVPVDLSHIIQQLEERFSTGLQSASGLILRGVLDVLGRVLDALLTLVLTFYLLLYGDQLWQIGFQLIPNPKRTQIQTTLAQSFRNYWIGQSTTAALMGISMTLAFLLLQIPFGLLFGMTIGVMALVPLGGALGIVGVTVLTAMHSFGLGMKVLGVALVIEWIIENGIAPRLIGEFLGLPPPLVFMSLLLGAKVGGILGLMMATPLVSFGRSLIGIFKPTTEPDPVLITEKPNQISS